MVETLLPHGPPEPLKYLGYSTDGNGNPSLTPAELQSVPPWPFFRDPIFIVIDYEGECGANATSEIGLSYLDARDLGPRSKPKKTAGKAKDEDYLTPVIVLEKLLTVFRFPLDISFHHRSLSKGEIPFPLLDS